MKRQDDEAAGRRSGRMNEAAGRRDDGIATLWGNGARWGRLGRLWSDKLPRDLLKVGGACQSSSKKADDEG
jgi:hypothetical protein